MPLVFGHGRYVVECPAVAVDRSIRWAEGGLLVPEWHWQRGTILLAQLNSYCVLLGTRSRPMHALNSCHSRYHTRRATPREAPAMPIGDANLECFPACLRIVKLLARQAFTSAEEYLDRVLHATLRNLQQTPLLFSASTLKCLPYHVPSQCPTLSTDSQRHQ